MKAKGINVSDTRIGTALGEINPEVQTKRQNRSLNPKVYNAKYFGDKLHYDENAKMRMFGVVYVFARDGFSGNIVGYATMARKTNLVLDEEICKLMIIFSFTRIMYFGLLKYFQVFDSLFRNSLRCNIKTSQLVFNNGTSFSC